MPNMICMKKLVDITLLISLMCICGNADAQLAAFPGAQGFGASATGGRGGEVIYVTNLNDSGDGSLRAAINTQGPRTIIFRVGGTINLESSLVIDNPSITIAGQTAPGDGITIRLGPLENGAALFIEAADVIIRHLRIRPGPADIGECCRDAITFFDGADRVIVDHVSLSWGTDETINAWGTSRNISIQRSVISEALLFASHSEVEGVFQPHSKGALFGDQTDRLSMHYNLLAHNNQRNPLINSNIGATYEHVNNIIYNWGDFASVFNGMVEDTLQINHIGNLYLPGINSRDNRWEVGVQPGSSTRVYVRDNLGPNRQEGDDEFAIVGSDINFVRPADPSLYQSLEPFEMSSFPIDVVPANSVLDNVAQDVGATLPRQDSIDRRVIQEVLNGQGRIIDDPSDVGGWINAVGGTAYVDADRDGMSDLWEQQNGLNTNDPEDRNEDPDNDGYTNLEEFLNSTDPGGDSAGGPSNDDPELCFPIGTISDAFSVVCL